MKKRITDKREGNVVKVLPFLLLKSQHNVLFHQKISGQDRTVSDLLKCETFVSILLFVFANDKLLKENKT